VPFEGGNGEPDEAKPTAQALGVALHILADLDHLQASLDSTSSCPSSSSSWINSRSRRVATFVSYTSNPEVVHSTV
jgi:hypothetical protein